MRFAQIQKGARAVTRVTVPIPGQAEPVPVLLRVLSADERATAVARGRAYAEGKGVKDPGDGSEVFGIGVQANTLVACARDADAPDAPFFTSAEEVLSLDPETIVYLYTYWQTHQDAHAPQQLNLTPDQYFSKVVAMAEAQDPSVFLSMRAGMQLSFTRITARLLVSYWTAKLPSGLSSEEHIANAMNAVLAEAARASLGPQVVPPEVAPS